jgi:Domain of Unknown Function (DUF928)
MPVNRRAKLVSKNSDEEVLFRKNIENFVQTMTPLKLSTLVLAAASMLLLQETGLFRFAANFGMGDRAPTPLGESVLAASVRSSLRYQLPKTRKLASTQGAGSRTGGETAQAKVELLVPKDHVAFTTKARPTFFWYVSKVPSAPVEFALHKQGVAAPILVKRVDITQAGLVKLEMPLDAPELTLDATKKYRWSVSIIAHEMQRSANPTYQAWIQRVQLAPEEMIQIQAATSDRERASIYAQSGLWYDALAEIATPYADRPSDPILRADLTLLLDQVGLAKLISGQS